MQENLKRTIGVVGLACAVVNITVGTGIFVLPALVAEHVGAAAILCYLICGLLIFLIALCFAELGSKVTISGGTYAYIGEAFGPYAGFLANIIFLASCVLSDAATANALAKTISYFFPLVDTSTLRPLFFLILFGGLALINILGAKTGIRFVMLTTFTKLIPLLLLIIIGMWHISMTNLQWNNSFSFYDIGNATLILFFAFLGIESAVANGGEFKNPARVVPLGIFSGLAFVLVFYISIQLITQGILGTQMATFKDAPLAAVAKIFFGTAGIAIMVATTAVSMLGNLSGEMLAVPRIIYAGARDGILPKILCNIHPKFSTPHAAIIVYAAMGLLLAVFGVFKQLIILTSATTLLIYLGVVLSTIKLRYKKTTSSEKAFIIPGGIIVPIVAIVAIIWLLSNLSKQEITGIAISLIVLSILYSLIRFFNIASTKNNHLV